MDRRGLHSRRQLLALGGCCVIAAVLPTVACCADGSFDISYLWSRSLDSVLDYREIIAGILGDEVARNLIVVRGGSGNFGLLLDQAEHDEAAARKLAAAHHARLRAALGGDEVLATVLPDKGFSRTHHVCYGVLEGEDEARRLYVQLIERLPAGTCAELVIEATGDGRWAVLAKRYGDEASTADLARAQTLAVAELGIVAVVVTDQNLEGRWAAGSAAAATEATTPAAPAPVREPPPAPPAALSVASLALGSIAKVGGNRPPAESPAPPAPPGTADDEGLELPAAIVSPLRDAINSHIQTLRHNGSIASDETTTWYVHTLHDDRTWAAINAEKPLQCASMVKPYVALAFFHQVAHGGLKYGKESRPMLEAMIQRSSNTATNWAMAQLGGPDAVQQLLMKHYGELLRETSVVEGIPSGGQTYRNRSSARDYVRFCRALWRNELPNSAEIRRLMALPGRDRLYTGAPAIPAGTAVYDKTGSTSRLCGDFGILVAKTKAGTDVPYSIVGIVEKQHPSSAYGAWVASRGNVIRSVSNLAYTTLQSHYGLV